jgi:hypothetical protein
MDTSFSEGEPHMMVVRHGGDEHEEGEGPWITKDVVVLLHGVPSSQLMLLPFYLFYCGLEIKNSYNFICTFISLFFIYWFYLWAPAGHDPGVGILPQHWLGDWALLQEAAARPYAPLCPHDTTRHTTHTRHDHIHARFLPNAQPNNATLQWWLQCSRRDGSSGTQRSRPWASLSRSAPACSSSFTSRGTGFPVRQTKHNKTAAHGAHIHRARSL